MYLNRYNKFSDSILSKTKIIIILLGILSSLILIDVYADRPIIDFHMELTPLETGSRFKFSCSLMNRGMKTGRNVSFVLKVPQGLKITNENMSAYFDSFPPLTKKYLEWTIEAVEIGTFDIECSAYSGTEVITKKLEVQAVYQMTIIVEKVRVIDDTDWFDPGEVYLMVRIDSTETRIPEEGEIRMENGDSVDINRVTYKRDVMKEPLLTINVLDRDLWGSDSLGSVNDYVPFNLGYTWFTTDNGKAEVLISSSSTIKIAF